MNKKVFTTIILIFCMFLCGVLFSCNKREKELRIIGTWRKVNIAVPNDPNIEEWIFTSNKIYRTLKKPEWAQKDTLEVAIYMIKAGLSKTTLTAMEFEYDAYNTTWNVIKLTDDDLAIHGYKDRNFQYLEFVKMK